MNCRGGPSGDEVLVARDGLVCGPALREVPAVRVCARSLPLRACEISTHLSRTRPRSDTHAQIRTGQVVLLENVE